MFAEPAVSGRGKGASKEPEPSIEARGGTYALSAFLAIGIHAGVLLGGFGELPFESAEYGVVRGESAVEVELVAAPPVPKDVPIEPVESHKPAASDHTAEPEGSIEIEQESEHVPTPSPEAGQAMPEPEPNQEAKAREARPEPTASRFRTASPKPRTAATTRKDASPAGRDSPSGENASSINEASGSLTSKPAYLHNPHPSYPEISRKAGHTGVVILRVSVSASGRVGAVSLVKSSGYSLLDDRARAAVRSWIFKPARRGGRSVATQVDVPIRFRLDR